MIEKVIDKYILLIYNYYENKSVRGSNMSNSNYNNQNVLLKIKRDFPTFDEEEILEYVKNIIPNIHYFLSYENEEKLEKYCKKECIKNIIQNKDLYRISDDIDNVRVGYADLRDYIEKDNKFYIKIYTSVFFYDDADNNQNVIFEYDKYWNDIWTITLEVNNNKNIANKCPSCGALMDYNDSKHMFTCNYCRNNLYFSRINWKIVDIAVNEINYK